MTKLLEDILDENDVLAIEAVCASSDTSFHSLVKVSGLDPRYDFQHADLRFLDMRGADLRGFDFTGSDLRQCVINRDTKIDETTIFEKARLDWIEVDALPIVQRMQEIESALTAESRRLLIEALIEEHGRTKHVNTYMVRAAGNAKELGQFLDFVTQLPSDLSQSQLAQIREQGLKLVAKKFNQARSRTRRNATAIFAVEPVFDRLEQSPGSLGRLLFNHLAEIVSTKASTRALRGVAIPDPIDFETAFSRLGRG